jgi:hypothetical protein
MKILKRWVAFLFFAATPLFGQQQNQTNVPPPTPYAVVARDANSRTWQRTVYEMSNAGTVVGKPHTFVEYASGLEVMRDGQWIDATEDIQLMPGNTGAAATNGQHLAFFPADLGQGVIELVTPDGIHLKNRPIGLSYFNGTNSVLFASLTNSAAQLLPSGSQILYTNIFGSDVRADLLISYHKSGTECDLILRSRLPDPAFWGMDPESIQTRVQLLTDFTGAQPPTFVSTLTNVQDGLVDSTLGFGEALFIPGRTFAVGNIDNSAGTTVYKTWYQNLSGKTVLVEEVPYARIKPQLDTLATLDPARSKRLASSVKRLRGMSASLGIAAPKRSAAASRPATVRLANADTGHEPGLAWDYTTVSGTMTNVTFQGDTTYYISSGLSLCGTNTWEGGSVLKFASNASITLIPGPLTPKLNFQSASYRPTVFTADADSAFGDRVTTNALAGYYANPALNLPGVGAQSLGNARFCYAQRALSLLGSSFTISNLQTVNCHQGASLEGTTLTLLNGLFENVPTNFVNLGSATINCQNTTFLNSSYLESVQGPSSSLLSTNCILANVTTPYDTNMAPFTLDGDFNGFYQSTEFGAHCATNQTYPFQTVGAGAAYLEDGCSFRNAGTTNLAAGVANILAQTTTYPPIVYSNVTISGNTTFGPQAQRDTDQPDLGYHYEPLDWALGNVQENSAAITVLPGTGIAVFGYTGATDEGFGLNGGSFTSIGTATSPVHVCEFSTVQEQSTGPWKCPQDSLYSASSADTCRFTVWTSLAQDLDHLFVGTSQRFQDCEFYGGSLLVFNSWTALSLTNCLSQRANLDLVVPN